MKLFIILGNQLFHPNFFPKNLGPCKFFMREDRELCTYFKFHQQKIVFFLSAMRHYTLELQGQGCDIHYEKFKNDQLRYEDALRNFIFKNSIQSIVMFEIEDKFFESRLIKLFQDLTLTYQFLPSPMFLTGRGEFQAYLKRSKKPFMKNFYELQRKKLKLLVDDQNQPIGGQWSYDADNRKALPQKIIPPELKFCVQDEITQEVIELVVKHFPDHVGNAREFQYPVTRTSAEQWLKDFLQERLSHFGPYEDAIPTHSDFLFHSLITPFMHVGLITPSMTIKQTLKRSSQEPPVSLPSLEGFIRQIVGWREFIRGIYQNYSDTQEQSNFFQHQKILSSHWYDGTTGIPPLDHAIKKTLRYGHCHHIERLMVVGSLMLLLEISPRSAYRWFMEMFIDSSDWVMGPNVFGMALFSDGGIFATKPYFCGSNYYIKMGPYKKSEAWTEGVDGLYWSFIEKHREFFLKNHRLSMMVHSLDKMDPQKKNQIFLKAEELRKKLTEKVM